MSNFFIHNVPTETIETSITEIVDRSATVSTSSITFTAATGTGGFPSTAITVATTETNTGRKIFTLNYAGTFSNVNFTGSPTEIVATLPAQYAGTPDASTVVGAAIVQDGAAQRLCSIFVFGPSITIAYLTGAGFSNGGGLIAPFTITYMA